jgi:predicted HicB family RNase H-like nuclease
VEYKGYRVGHLSIDAEAGVIHGRVLLDRDMVTFESDTGAGLVKEFRDSVDGYLASCADFGVAPEPPPSPKTGSLKPKDAARRTVRELMAKLKARRSEMGLSLTDMSEVTGLERSAVVKLETKTDQNPTISTLFRYALPLGVVIEIEPKVMPPAAKSGKTKLPRRSRK